jgi:hypothetical protein
MEYGRRAQMSIIRQVGEYLKSKSEKVPGLAYVATIISGIMAIFLNVSEENFGLWIISIVWFVSFMFYFFSGIIDDIIYEPLYGLPRSNVKGLKFIWLRVARIIFAPIRWVVDSLPKTRDISEVRQSAARKFHSNKITGIYGSAKKIFDGRDEWQDKVKIWLDLSKAARAFIIPLFIVLISDLLYVVSGWPDVRAISNYNILNWFIHWPVALIALITIFIVYLWFRILHMIALYDLVAKANVFTFEVAPIDAKNKNMQKMVCVGSVVLPANELPIYKSN